MSEAGPFRGRTALWLGIAAAVSLSLSALLAVFGDAFGPPASPGADGFSRSALGHAAFLEVLRARGVVVTTSRHRTPDRAGEAVVFFLEPRVRAQAPRDPDDTPGEREREPDPAAAVLSETREAAWRLLVVLPKRQALFPLRERPGWLGRTTLAPISAAQAVLDALGIEGEVIRPAAPAAFEGELPLPSLDAPQLVRSEALVPLVSTADGVLAGELVGEDEHIVVLADPDVLATHGLGDGRNADLAVALAERLGAAEHGVVVDETLHGFELQPSLTRELLRPPLVLATAQALVTLALLAWIALVRFGRPHPAPPALGAGSAVLIDHTAGLLGAAGHAGTAAGAYWRAARDEIVRRLRPGGTSGADADGWLERAAAARGLGARLAAIRRQVAALSTRGAEAEHDTLRVARDIHRLREELTHGRDAHDAR